MQRVGPKSIGEGKYEEMAEPCRNGHLSYRYLSNGACWACQDARRRQYRASEKGARTEAASRKAAYDRNPEKYREASRKRFSNNPGLAAEQSRMWRERNPDAVKAYSARYVREQSALKARLAADYTARKLRATPAWADPEAILEVYREAERLTAETGIAHEVDHVVPLRGKQVCGLHVAENLRAIPKAENRKKYNTFHD